MLNAFIFRDDSLNGLLRHRNLAKNMNFCFDVIHQQNKTFDFCQLKLAVFAEKTNFYAKKLLSCTKLMCSNSQRNKIECTKQINSLSLVFELVFKLKVNPA